MATAAAAAGGGGGGTALGADLASPIAALPDKWKLLPAFLQARGLVKQHIESFDYFFDTELRNIVEANREVRSDVEPKWWLRYTNIHVARPSVSEWLARELTIVQTR
jgi:DNA-directed RNA polymerase III subunit RPC2